MPVTILSRMSLGLRPRCVDACCATALLCLHCWLVVLQMSVLPDPVPLLLSDAPITMAVVTQTMITIGVFLC
jgi:hypothetical protein